VLVATEVRGNTGGLEKEHQQQDCSSH
jgi:hypothetical protein